MKHPFDRSKQKNLQGFCGKLIFCRTEKAMQSVAYPLCAIPLQVIQVVPDRVIMIFVGNNANCCRHPFFAVQAVFSIRRRMYIISVSVSVGPERCQPIGFTISIRSLSRFSRMESARLGRSAKQSHSFESCSEHHLFQPARAFCGCWKWSISYFRIRWAIC